MTKFKKGDFVVCHKFAGINNLEAGTPYEVLKCSANYVSLLLEKMYDGRGAGEPNTFSVDRFESLEEWANHQVRVHPEVELSLAKLQVKGLKELKASHEKTLKESYSAILWLYRRLPSCYESPPHIESAIKNLAKALGEDAQVFIDERKGMK